MRLCFKLNENVCFFKSLWFDGLSQWTNQVLLTRKASTFVPYSTTAFATHFYMWGNNEKKMFLGWRKYVKVHLGSWLGLLIPKIDFGLCQNHRWPTLISHLYFPKLYIYKASLVAPMVKKLPAMQETWVWSLGWEDPLEEGMATHSNILAWRIPLDRGA